MGQELPHSEGDSRLEATAQRQVQGPESSADSTFDLPEYRRSYPLEHILSPKSVAVIGASERAGSVGRTILWNLISSPFGGTVYPVNSKRSNVLGIKTYPSVAELPEVPDLGIIVTPAATVPEVVRECGRAGIRGLVIVSAGFKEIGEQGIKLEREILQIAQEAKIRLIGPNCLGVMRPPTGLNATFANCIALPGTVAFVSQSGALLTAILDWSLREKVGFSCFASLGSMLDVGWGDLIDYLGEDPHTKSILIYMESIGDARAFLSAARQVALRKPIIVIKAGRTPEAAHAAASHTGALVGSDEVLSAAFRRAGVLRVDTIAELFYMAEALARQPRPEGNRLTIITNAGGPGVLATDALVSGGGQLTPLSDATRAALDDLLPGHWSHGNPVDILGDADPERYARSFEIVAQDANTDGLLVILTPQDMTDPTKTAEKLKSSAERLRDKPIIASWMGGMGVAAGEQILNETGIATSPYPDTGARIFNLMWRYSYNIRGLYETPTLADTTDATTRRDEAKQIIKAARQAGRTLLSELESKALLRAYGIPSVEMRLAISAEAAVEHAKQLGYPVVLKLHSKTIAHKSDVGGVHLDLTNAGAVREAYGAIRARLEELGKLDGFDGVTVQPMVKLTGTELILGSSTDSQFGPVLLFGMGGTLVEVYRDRALALPPLNSTLARRMMEQTRIYQALQGVRGRASVDIDALEQLLVSFSELVVEQRLIKEVDINPLLASPEGLVALDARVILHPPDIVEADLPPLPIPPYPLQYVKRWQLKDGTSVTIRPIRPEDENKMVAFHQTLSEQSVYMRYAGVLRLSQRIMHDRLSRICFIDYDREMALVAEKDGTASMVPEIIAVGRLTRLHGTRDGEYAMLVTDRYQHQGLGAEISRRLLEVAHDWELEQIVADVLPQNGAMQRALKTLGFSLHADRDSVRAIKVLAQQAA
jgi:acetyltransferase